MKFVDSVDLVDRPRLEKLKNVLFVPFVPRLRLISGRFLGSF